MCVDDAIIVIEGHDPTMAHNEMMQEGEECQSAPLYSEVVGLSSSKQGSASPSYSVPKLVLYSGLLIFRNYTS